MISCERLPHKRVIIRYQTTVLNRFQQQAQRQKETANYLISMVSTYNCYSLSSLGNPETFGSNIPVDLGPRFKSNGDFLSIASHHSGASQSDNKFRNSGIIQYQEHELKSDSSGGRLALSTNKPTGILNSLEDVPQNNNDGKNLQSDPALY